MVPMVNRMLWSNQLRCYLNSPAGIPHIQCDLVERKSGCVGGQLNNIEVLEWFHVLGEPYLGEPSLLTSDILITKG